MIVETAASVAAGVGLSFIGIKTLSGSMGQLTGRRMRYWVQRSTGNYVLGAIVGLLSGALTQSTNAITVILMSLASVDVISPRNAKPILSWANVGTSALVLVAAIDIHVFVLVLVAATGLCYYLNLDRSGRWRPMVSALLAVGLLFLGLELMRGGSRDAKDLEFLQTFFFFATQWNLTTLLVGALLALVAQSSMMVSIVAMASSGLLSLEQSMLVLYGACIGSGIGTYLIAVNVRGTPRQLGIYQIFVSVAGIALLIPLYLVERIFDVPLVGAAIRSVTLNPSTQVALVYLTCQLTAVLVATAVGRFVSPLLDTLSPPSAQENFAKPQYIYEQALNDPETALVLVDREQARVFGLLPVYLGITDHLDGDAKGLVRRTVHPIAVTLTTAIMDFLSQFADTGASRRVLERVADRQARNTLLLSIHDSLAELAENLSEPFETPALQSLRTNLTEGLGALLLAAEDAVRTLDIDDLALLRQLTGDRDSLVDGLRRRVMAADRLLPGDDQRHLYALTSLFERIVWMLRRYVTLLALEVEPEAEIEVAEVSQAPGEALT